MRLLDRRPAKVVAVALAKKMARIAWAVLAKGETYRTSAHTTSLARPQPSRFFAWGWERRKQLT
jgi:hypothetical protein